MLYDQSEIVELLNCEHCSQPYDQYYQPRILPCCDKTICSTCVKLIQKQLKDNKFKCIACNKVDIMPKDGLQVSEPDAKPLEKLKGPEAERIKQNLRYLESLINKLTFEIDNGECLIRKNCSQLRKQVQWAKENRINEINKHCEGLLKKIDLFEEKRIRKYKEMNLLKQQDDEFIKLVNESIQQQKDYLMQLKINDKETIACNEKIEELKTKIEKERKNIKKSVFDNQFLKFEANTTSIDEALLGKLIQDTFDFDRILSASWKTIKLLDMNSGECLKIFLGHSDWVFSVKQLSENKIVSCSQDKAIKIWDLATGDCIKTLLGHSKIIWSFVIMSNNRIASCSEDKTIRVWELQSDLTIKVLKGHTGGVYSIAKLSNEMLLSGSRDATIKLWNANSGECLRTFVGHLDSVTCVEILSNQRILSGSDDTTVKVWNVYTGDCLKTLRGHSDSLRCIQVISLEKIISGSADKTIRIWCLKTNSCIKTINGHSEAVRGIQLLSNERLLSCSDDKTIKIWDLGSASCIKTFQTVFLQHGISSIDVF